MKAFRTGSFYAAVRAGVPVVRGGIARHRRGDGERCSRHRVAAIRLERPATCVRPHRGAPRTTARWIGIDTGRDLRDRTRSAGAGDAPSAGGDRIGRVFDSRAHRGRESRLASYLVLTDQQRMIAVTAAEYVERGVRPTCRRSSPSTTRRSETPCARRVGFGTLPILYFGTEGQKRKYLPRFASGEWRLRPRGGS